MKKIFIFILILSAGSVYALDNRLETELGKFNLTAAERNAIVAVFEDAKAKGIDSEDLIDVLREQGLKGASFYETLESLARKEKEIDEIRKSGFPFVEKKDVRFIASCWINTYTAKQFQELTRMLKEGKTGEKEIRELFRFQLDLVSFGLQAGDSYQIMHAMVKNGYYSKPDLDAVRRLYMRSRELKMDRKTITLKLSGGLSGGNPLKNVIYEIRKESAGR